MTDNPNPERPDDPIGRLLGDFLNGTGPSADTPPEVEPNAELMGLAHNLFEQFTAYRRAGFDERQAFALTATALSTMLGRGPQ